MAPLFPRRTGSPVRSRSSASADWKLPVVFVQPMSGGADPAVAEAFGLAMARYESERQARLSPEWTGPVPTGGIAGSKGGVKCLHAQYADTAAGNDNPIGEDVAERIEPFSCVVPCVVASDAGMILNDEWVEPS